MIDFLKKKKSCFRSHDEGMMGVEALIGFSLFIFAMFVIMSWIWLFFAHDKIGHALGEACQSMALESYRNSVLGFSLTEEDANELDDALTALFVGAMTKSDSRNNFVSNKYWSAGDDVESVAEQRFYAYLGGSTESGKSIMTALGVLEDASFEGSGIDGEDITIQITYRIRPLLAFEIFGKTDRKVTQSVTCRMWKK
ncbi:MAG: hypothetical protein IJ608_01105 [Lachnospiraceae bacterium]|nr:hypothetical protein [Lachnospiraceae bacterium]